MRLRVVDVWRPTNAITVVNMASAEGKELPPWQAGAHIPVEFDEEVRTYSLCSDPIEAGRYRIAVRSETTSTSLSRILAQQVTVGDVLICREPVNRFVLEPASSYLLVGGGIGVSPLIAMAAQLARAGESCQFMQVARHVEEFFFADEVALLGIPIFRQVGRAGFLNAVREKIHELPWGSGVYCCGPAELTSGVRAMARERRDLDFRAESFAPPPDPGERYEGEGPIRVRLLASGVDVQVQPGTSILDAVREVLDVPWSCGEGFCGTCEAKVLGGEPIHKDQVLSDMERSSSGRMIICVGWSQTRELSLDL